MAVNDISVVSTDLDAAREQVITLLELAGEAAESLAREGPAPDDARSEADLQREFVQRVKVRGVRGLLIRNHVLCARARGHRTACAYACACARVSVRVRLCMCVRGRMVRSCCANKQSPSSSCWYVGCPRVAIGQSQTPGAP